MLISQPVPIISAWCLAAWNNKFSNDTHRSTTTSHETFRKPRPMTSMTCAAWMPGVSGLCLDGLHEVGSSDLDGAYLCTILARAELNVNLKYYWWIRYMDIYIAHRSIRIFMGLQEDIHGAGVFFTCCHRTWAAFRSSCRRGRKPTKKRMRRAAKAVPKNLCLGVQGSLSDSSNRVQSRVKVVAILCFWVHTIGRSFSGGS